MRGFVVLTQEAPSLGVTIKASPASPRGHPAPSPRVSPALGCVSSSEGPHASQLAHGPPQVSSLMRL